MDTQHFFDSAGAMVESMFAQLLATDPAIHAGVSDAIRQGAFLRLQTVFGSGGLIDCSLWLCGQGGNIELFTLTTN